MCPGAGCAGVAHCPGQTDDEYKTEFVVWSLTQSPLIVDTDVRNMTVRTKRAKICGVFASVAGAATHLAEPFLPPAVCGNAG